MQDTHTTIHGACRSAAPVLGLAAAGLIIVGAACRAPVRMPAGGSGEATAAPAPGIVEWVATHYAYDAPERLPSGWVTIRLTNHGQEPHHGQLLRLNEGVTYEEFVTALADEGEGALRLATAVGGPALIDAHHTE
jgi:hypothetical protein